MFILGCVSPPSVSMYIFPCLFSPLWSSSLWFLVPWFTGMKPLRPSSASTRRSSVPLPLSQWQTQKRRTRGEEFCWRSNWTRRLQLRSSFFHFSLSSSKRCRDTKKDLKKKGIQVSLGAHATFLGKCFKHGSFVMRRLHQCLSCISFAIHWNAVMEQELVLTVSRHDSSLLCHFCVLYISVLSPNF